MLSNEKEKTIFTRILQKTNKNFDFPKENMKNMDAFQGLALQRGISSPTVMRKLNVHAVTPFCNWMKTLL